MVDSRNFNKNTSARPTKHIKSLTYTRTELPILGGVAESRVTEQKVGAC